MGLADQFGFFSGADVHFELLMTAILGGLKFFVSPTRCDVVAFVDVDVALVLEENQCTVCTSKPIVVTEEIALCHSRLLLSFCTLIIAYIFRLVNNYFSICPTFFSTHPCVSWAPGEKSTP
jgi:hypothetical protein